MSSLNVQHQIRRNAEEQAEFLRTMGSWEEDIKKRDKEMRERKEKKEKEMRELRKKVCERRSYERKVVVYFCFTFSCNKSQLHFVFVYLLAMLCTEEGRWCWC